MIDRSGPAGGIALGLIGIGLAGYVAYNYLFPTGTIDLPTTWPSVTDSGQLGVIEIDTVEQVEISTGQITHVESLGLESGWFDEEGNAHHMHKDTEGRLREYARGGKNEYGRYQVDEIAILMMVQDKCLVISTMMWAIM